MTKQSGASTRRSGVKKFAYITEFSPRRHERRVTMIRIAQVPYPIDFSEIAQHALDHAVAIACRYEARLTVLYVFATCLPPLMLEPQPCASLARGSRRP